MDDNSMVDGQHLVWKATTLEMTDGKSVRKSKNISAQWTNCVLFYPSLGLFFVCFNQFMSSG